MLRSWSEAPRWTRKETSIRDPLIDLERHARGVLHPGEQLLAAVRATTPGLFGGSLGVIGGTVAVGSLVQLAVMSRSAKRARESGFPAAPSMVIALSNLRLLVWRASHLSNRPTKLLGEVPLHRLADVRVEERLGQSFVTFSIRGVPPVTLVAVKRHRPGSFAEAFLSSTRLILQDPVSTPVIQHELPQRELVGAGVGAGAMAGVGAAPLASADSLPSIPPPPPGSVTGASEAFGLDGGPDVGSPSGSSVATQTAPAEPAGGPAQADGHPDGKACPQCGTRSSETASFCWSCYASFPRDSDPGPAGMLMALQAGSSTRVPAGAREGTLPEIAWEPPSGHLGDPRSGQVTGRLGYEPLPPTRATSTGSMSTATKVVAAAVALALMFVTIGYLASRRHSTELAIPESIAGARRITSAQLDQVVAQLENAGKAYGVTGRAAYYGTTDIPTFFFVAYGYQSKAEETSDVVFEEFSRGWAGAAGDAHLDMTTKDTQVQGRTTTVCVRVRGATRGSLCMWQDPKVIGFVMALHQGLPFTRTLTTSVQLAVER